MNTTPDPTQNPRLWACHQAYAASLLAPNFADNILRAARLRRDDPAAHARIWRFLHNPFALSAITACACFAAVVFFHTQSVSHANEKNLADWRGLAEQIASLDPL